MSVIKEMTALLERQKATPVLGTPGIEKPTRKGAFKVSASALKFFKQGGIDPKDTVFKNEKAIIDKIPRQELPKIFGKKDLADTQDFLAAKPKQAFQKWMRDVGKVEPKVKKMLQRVPQNAPLWFYLFMLRISGQMMADEIFKRHFYSKDTGHPGELKRKKKTEDLEERTKGPSWKKAAEKLMKSITGKDQESFRKRAYLRAVIQGNQAQATHVAKNMLDPKTAKDLRMKLIDLAGKNESLGLPKDWKRIAGIEPTYRGWEVLQEDEDFNEESAYEQAAALLDKDFERLKSKGVRQGWWIPGKAWAVNLPLQGAQVHIFTLLDMAIMGRAKATYRKADNYGPEGIIINPRWASAGMKTYPIEAVPKMIDLIKREAPSIEKKINDDLDRIEKDNKIEIPSAIRSKIVKGGKALAKRRWDVNMLRQHGTLYPFDGGKPMKLDSWGGVKRK
jgi:hypothetical protein